MALSITKPDVSEKSGTAVACPPISSPVESLPFELADFPEGGWRAWSTVLGVWLVQFCTIGYANSWGIYQDFYVREYLNDKNSSQISWIGSIQEFLLSSLGLITGWAFDRGYFYHLMIGSSLIFSFCLFMVSLTQPHQYYPILVCQGIGNGVAFGMVYVPSFGIIAHYFRRRRALAMGIAASGASVGGLVHPIMLNRLFHGSVGFQNGVRASAAFNSGLLLLAMLLMRTRLPPRPSSKGSIAHIRFFIRDHAYVFAVAGSFFFFAGIFVPPFFLQLHAVKHGFSTNAAFYIISVLFATSTIGRILPNMIADKAGVFNLSVFCTAACGILVFCLEASKSVVGAFIFAGIFGFFSGAVFSLLAPMLALLAKDINEVGVRMGICFTFTGVGGLIGAPIAGALLSAQFTWWRPIVFAGICLMAAAGCFCAARFLVARKSGAQII